MTRYQIYRLAWLKQTELWSKAEETASALPGNEIARERERRAWKDLEELEALLKKEERKNK